MGSMGGMYIIHGHEHSITLYMHAHVEFTVDPSVPVPYLNFSGCRQGEEPLSRSGDGSGY